jgi:hypothetical protein
MTGVTPSENTSNSEKSTGSGLRTRWEGGAPLEGRPPFLSSRDDYIQQLVKREQSENFFLSSLKLKLLGLWGFLNARYPR